MNTQLVEVVRMMAETYDLQPLLNSIERAANTLLPCSRAQILEFDAQHEEFFKHELRISARIGPSARAAATQRTIRVDTTKEQETLVVPLVAPGNEVMGVLHVLGPVGHRFSEADSELALMLGSLAAIAVKRQTLVDQAAEKERLDRELALAREIVHPPATPTVPGFELTGSFHPAKQVGGDCYDFKPLPQGLALLVADASGHGLDSALVVSRCRAYFRALMDESVSLSEVAARMNNLLAEDLEGNERFVAASLGRLDRVTGRLEVLSAGQTCCLWAPPEGPVQSVEAAGPPLGLFRDQSYATRTLQPSLALFYTDGLPDWRNAEGECFGEERLAAALERWKDEPLQVYEEALRFAGGVPHNDDVTCLLLRRQEPSPIQA